MTEIEWGRYPIIATDERARAWLQIHGDLGRAPNTVDAYGRGLEDYFRFSHHAGVRQESERAREDSGRQLAAHEEDDERQGDPERPAIGREPLAVNVVVRTVRVHWITG